VAGQPVEAFASVEHKAAMLSLDNAMDAAVGRLSGLNAFVAQQITLWNNQKG